MSLPGFDTLRRTHPTQQVVVERLEAEIARTLRRDNHAVLDHQLLSQLVEVGRDQVGQLLAELVKVATLRVRWFWICPVNRGTVMEADDEAEFPDSVECSVCGQAHRYSIDDTEVEFLPTAGLLRAAVSEQ